MEMRVRDGGDGSKGGGNSETHREVVRSSAGRRELACRLCRRTTRFILSSHRAISGRCKKLFHICLVVLILRPLGYLECLVSKF